MNNEGKLALMAIGVTAAVMIAAKSSIRENEL